MRSFLFWGAQPIVKSRDEEKQLKLSGSVVSAAVVADMLRKTEKLVNVDLSNCNLSDEDGTKIVRSLANNDTVKTLNLTSNSLGESTAQVLAQVLATNTTLTWVSFQGEKVGFAAALELANRLRQNTALTSFRFRSTGSEHVMCLLNVLTNNTRLTSFTLGGDAYPAIDDYKRTVLSLAGVLKNNKTLQSLNLSGLLKKPAPFSGEAATIVADALRHNHTLNVLTLENNGFDAAAILAIATALKSSEVKIFRLVGNVEFARDNDAKMQLAIANALGAIEHIDAIEVSNCLMNDDGALAFANMLKTNSTITFLDLSTNAITDKGASALAEMIKINKTLTTINLAGTYITDNGAKELIDALQTNKTITRLVLNFRYVSDENKTRLFALLHRNQQQQKVEQQHQYIADSAEKIDDENATELKLMTRACVSPTSLANVQNASAGHTPNDDDDGDAVNTAQASSTSSAATSSAATSSATTSSATTSSATTSSATTSSATTSSATTSMGISLLPDRYHASWMEGSIETLDSLDYSYSWLYLDDDTTQKKVIAVLDNLIHPIGWRNLVYWRHDTDVVEKVLETLRSRDMSNAEIESVLLHGLFRIEILNGQRTYHSAAHRLMFCVNIVCANPQPLAAQSQANTAVSTVDQIDMPLRTDQFNSMLL